MCRYGVAHLGDSLEGLVVVDILVVANRVESSLIDVVSISELCFQGLSPDPRDH